MNRLRLLALALTVAVSGACANDSARSLLPVDLTAAPEVGAISKVTITVTQGGNPVTAKDLAWDAPAGQPLKVGLYLPHSLGGTVEVSALALDGMGATIGGSEVAMAVITPGKTADVVALQLTPRGATNADGGGAGDGSPSVDDGSCGGNGETSPPPPDGGVDMGPASDMTGHPGDMGGLTPDAAAPVAYHAPENLEPNDAINPSYYPQAAVDGKGNALVCWVEDSEVKCRRWDSATKMWGETKSVESKGSVDGPSLKMAPNGHAVLLWNQTADGDPLRGVWASASKDGGLTWSPPKQIHAGPSYADLALGVSRDGSARAAWDESANNMHAVWSARYDDATGIWTDAATLKPPVGMSYDNLQPRVAMDAMGGGIVSWRQPDDVMMQESTWAAAFTAGGSVKTPQLLDELTTDWTYDPVVAITPDGSKGVVVWSQKATSGYDVYASDYTSAGGFAKPTRALVNSYYGWPVIVMDQAATATLAYYQPLTLGTANVVAVRRAWGQAWGQPTPLETTNQARLMVDEVPVVDMGIDSNGDVHVAWHRRVSATDENTFSIVTRRWSMNGWQPEQVVFVKDKMHGNHPSVGVGEGGQACIAFTYWDPSKIGDANTFSVFAALFP